MSRLCIQKLNQGRQNARLIVPGLCVVGALIGSRLPAQHPTTVADGQVSSTRTLQKTLAHPLTFTLTNVSLKRAIDSVSRVSKVLIEYQASLLMTYTKSVTIDVKDVPLGIVLERILAGTNLKINAGGDGSLIVEAATVAVDSTPDQGTISGRIVDSATGHGLSGVTIKVTGTKLSAMTQDSGHFTVQSVPAGHQLLTLRVFGYHPAEQAVDVAAGQTATVHIQLAAVPNVLSGVVTTAAGVQRRVEVGNDVTVLNVDSVMKVAPILSVTDLLETRVPGMTVQHSSGAPGDPSRIRIRGASSLTGNNDPIVIVDGIRVYASQSDPRNDNLAPSQIGRVTGYSPKKDGITQNLGYATPSPLDQIDPNSIETLEVLKGPSASAMYGSDAANGVIVITTKHGRAGPTHWTTGVGLGMNEEPGNWPINYFRFGTGFNDGSGTISFFCAWNDNSCVQDSVVAFQALNDPRYTVFANHGSDQTYNASVSGGVQTLLYNFTGSAARQVGLLKLPGIEEQRYTKFYDEPGPGWMRRPQNYTTWGVSGQVTVQPSTTIRATVMSSLFNSDQQNSSLEAAIAQLQGTYIQANELGINPLVTQFVERATSHQLTSTNNVSLDWQALSWLPINVTGGVNTIQRTDETLIPYGINSSTTSSNPDTTGSYGLGRGTSQVSSLSLNTHVPTLHNRLTLSIGGNYAGTATSDFQAFTTQLEPGITSPSNFPTQYVNGAAGTPSSFTQSTVASSTYGVYLQTQLHVLGSLYLNPGFRLDGGSNSGSNASLGAGGIPGLTGFPKIDLSYLLIDQEHPRGIISLLRPRLALGKAGTQPNATARLRLFDGRTPVSLNADTSYVPTAVLSSFGNTQLQPERSDEVEGGFDVELWNGRTSLTWTQYNKTRHNAIISIPVALSVDGGGSIYKNIGVVRNTGFESQFTVQPVQSRAFGWTVSGNVSTNHNLVVRLNPGQSTIDLGNGSRFEAGYPLSGRWEQPITAFADANGDGIIEPNEIHTGDSAVYVGSQDPNYQLNLSTGITLLSGHLSVNGTFAYQNGSTQFNDGALNSGAFMMLPNAPGTPLALQAAVTAATGGFCTGYQPYSNSWEKCGGVTSIGVIQTVNTFRFNDLSINYVMPATWARVFHAQSMSMALQGSNLGFHSNYRGKDPGVNAFSTVSSGDETIDLGGLPQPRTWWLKLSVGN